MQTSWAYWLIANAKASEAVSRAPDVLDAERLQGWVHGSVWGLIALNLVALSLFLASLCGKQIEGWIAAAWSAYKNWRLEKVKRLAEFQAAATVATMTDQASAVVAAVAADLPAPPPDTTPTASHDLAAATLAPTEVGAPEIAPTPEAPVYAPPSDDVAPVETAPETPTYAPPADDTTETLTTLTEEIPVPNLNVPPPAETVQSSEDAWGAFESQLSGLDFNAMTQIGDTQKLAGANAGPSQVFDVGVIVPVQLPPELEPKASTPEEGFKLLEIQLTTTGILTDPTPIKAPPAAAPAPPSPEPQTSLPAGAVSAEKVGMSVDEGGDKVGTAMDFEKSLESLLAETNFEATEELPIFDLKALEATLDSAIQSTDVGDQPKDSVA